LLSFTASTNYVRELRIVRELLPANSSACASEECKMRAFDSPPALGYQISLTIRVGIKKAVCCWQAACRAALAISPLERAKAKIAFCQMSKQKQQ
jgi:hypothetical protein